MAAAAGTWWAPHRAKTDPKAVRNLPPLVDDATKDSLKTPIPRPAASKSNDILQKYLKEFSERSESLMLSFNSYASSSSATHSTTASYEPGSRSRPSSVASAASALASGLPLGLSALKGADMGKSIMLNGHTNTKEGEGKEEQSHHDKSAEGDDHEKPAYPTIEKRRSSPYTDEQVQAFLQNKSVDLSKREETSKPTTAAAAGSSSLSYSDRMRMEMERERTGVGASSAKSSSSSSSSSSSVAAESTPAAGKSSGGGGSRADSLRAEKEKRRTRDSLGGLENLDKILETEVSTDLSSSLSSSVIATNVQGGKMWQPQFTLRHHLDVVRSVAFHEEEPMLVSAGDDCTVKIWNWRTAGTVGFGKLITNDVEPVHTLLGHTGPVYSVALASAKDRIFSAGADGHLRVWELPDLSLNDPYAERGKAINFDLAVLKGHTDAIWDVALHPTLSLVLTASADESIKLWDFGASKGQELKLTVPYFEADKSVVPTSLCFLPNEPQKWVAGYASSSLGIFDTESGKCVQTMHAQAAPTHTADPDSQINKVVAHGRMGLVITGHEDHTIRFWDPRTGGEAVHKMVAHQAPVSSLAIDPSGIYLASTDHGLSVRFWEISSKNCVQEITSHRQKYDEGIYCVDFHPRLDLLATGGADACIKVYQ